ncbi:MAG TPA: hypothetical protein VK694_03575 [Verrucomicrobiae bacterium]|nr:hypothetical protein [Verrucomicrobiae bacterium]
MTDRTPTPDLSSDSTPVPDSPTTHTPNVSPTARVICYVIAAILATAGLWLSFVASTADSSTILISLGILTLAAMAYTAAETDNLSDTPADDTVQTTSRRQQVPKVVAEFMGAAYVTAFAIMEAFRLHDGRINDNRVDQICTVLVIVVCLFLAMILSGHGFTRLDRNKAQTVTNPNPTGA